jgi:subtilase family serine protease
MVGFRPGIARCHRLPGRVSGLAIAIGLLVAACGPAHTASDAGPTAGATAGASSTASPSGGSTAECNSVTTCYTPQQLQVAYGVRPLLDRGINGQGETVVVLPELAESQLNPPDVTDMRQDMARFDNLFGLPPARMRVVTTLAGASSPWLAYGEEVLDIEMVHALAPGATLVIVLVPSTALDNTPNAVASAVASLRLGSSLGDVISASEAGQVGGEHCVSRAQARSVNAALQEAASRQVTVVAASGDTGAAEEPCSLNRPSFTPVKGVTLLASDPLVLGAGGTSLTASHTTGAWQGETAWGLPYGDPGSAFQASGGGFSRLFPRPGYQDGVPAIRATRATRATRGCPTCRPTPTATPAWRSS